MIDEEKNLLDVFESLLKGERKYPAAFQQAKLFWTSFFDQHAANSDSDLADALDKAQMAFQWKMEEVGLEKPLAKDLMALTCIGSLYNDGFDDRSLAVRVINILENNRSISLSVRGPATEVKALYGLNES